MAAAGEETSRAVTAVAARSFIAAHIAAGGDIAKRGVP
jgi:hypothetical protein